jgi:hypothetical protein
MPRGRTSMFQRQLMSEIGARIKLTFLHVAMALASKVASTAASE